MNKGEVLEAPRVTISLLERKGVPTSPDSLLLCTVVGHKGGFTVKSIPATGKEANLEVSYCHGWADWCG